MQEVHRFLWIRMFPELIHRRIDLNVKRMQTVGSTDCMLLLGDNSAVDQ
jgi:hypothetical protein